MEKFALKMKLWENLTEREQKQIINEMMWTYYHRESLEFEINNFPEEIAKRENPEISSEEIKSILNKEQEEK